MSCLSTPIAGVSHLFSFHISFSSVSFALLLLAFHSFSLANCVSFSLLVVLLFATLFSFSFGRIVAMAFSFVLSFSLAFALLSYFPLLNAPMSIGACPPPKLVDTLEDCVNFVNAVLER